MSARHTCDETLPKQSTTKQSTASSTTRPPTTNASVSQSTPTASPNLSPAPSTYQPTVSAISSAQPAVSLVPNINNSTKNSPVVVLPPSSAAVFDSTDLDVRFGLFSLSSKTTNPSPKLISKPTPTTTTTAPKTAPQNTVNAMAYEVAHQQQLTESIQDHSALEAEPHPPMHYSYMHHGGAHYMPPSFTSQHFSHFDGTEAPGMRHIMYSADPSQQVPAVQSYAPVVPAHEHPFQLPNTYQRSPSPGNDSKFSGQQRINPSSQNNYRDQETNTTSQPQTSSTLQATQPLTTPQQHNPYGAYASPAIFAYPYLPNQYPSYPASQYTPGYRYYRPNYASFPNATSYPGALGGTPPPSGSSINSATSYAPEDIGQDYKNNANLFQQQAVPHHSAFFNVPQSENMIGGKNTTSSTQNSSHNKNQSQPFSQSPSPQATTSSEPRLTNLTATDLYKGQQSVYQNAPIDASYYNLNQPQFGQVQGGQSQPPNFPYHISAQHYNGSRNPQQYTS